MARFRPSHRTVQKQPYAPDLRLSLIRPADPRRDHAPSLSANETRDGKLRDSADMGDKGKQPVFSSVKISPNILVGLDQRGEIAARCEKLLLAKPKQVTFPRDLRN